MNFGYRTGAVWLRFALKLGTDAPVDWLLEVAYPPLDRVSVFVRGPDGRLVLQEAGDMLPFWKRPFPHRNLVFPLRFVPGTEYTLFIRVESEGNATIPVHLWQPAALAEHDRAAYATLAFYYGLLFALVGFNLLIFISVRDPLYLFYVGMAVGMAIGQLSLNGFGVLWLWPDSIKWANDALAWGFALCGLSGALFTRRFLETARHTPLLDRLLLFATVVFAAAGPVRDVRPLSVLRDRREPVRAWLLGDRSDRRRSLLAEGSAGCCLFPARVEPAARWRGHSRGAQHGLAADQRVHDLCHADRLGTRDGALLLRTGRSHQSTAP